MQFSISNGYPFSYLMIKARFLIVNTCLYKGISKLRISTSKKVTMYYCHQDNQCIKIFMICDTGSQTWTTHDSQKAFQKLHFYSLERGVCHFSAGDSFRNLGISGPKEKDWERALTSKRSGFTKYQLCGIRQITVLQNEIVTPIPFEKPLPPKTDLKTKYRYVA